MLPRAVDRAVDKVHAAVQPQINAYYARSFDVLDVDDPLPVLWSKGISRLCDVHGPASYWCAPTESVQPDGFFREHYANAAGLVWVRLGSHGRTEAQTDLDRFAEEALPTIRQPFVLVTSDGDASVPTDIDERTVAAIMSSPWLTAWYTQNCATPEVDALSPLPIGLDLHTPRGARSPRALLRRLANLRADRTEAVDQPPVAFTDLSVCPASEERIAAVRTLRDCPHVTMQRRRVSQQQIWKRYAAFPFVLSAPGHGLDCHRTWEALYLGSIVVTRRSPLDSLFAGLPVVLVDSWDEVLDESNLRAWHATHAPLTAKEHVWNLLDPALLDARMRGDMSR